MTASARSNNVITCGGAQRKGDQKHAPPHGCWAYLIEPRHVNGETPQILASLRFYIWLRHVFHIYESGMKDISIKIACIARSKVEL